MSAAANDSTSVVRYHSVAGKRDVDRIPFVEIFENRLQGVVSSESAVERVYCAFIDADDGGYYSSTNNNRPDAGMAKRLNWLLQEAQAQFGAERVKRFTLSGQRKPEQASIVFSRFLNYLRHVELHSAAGPVPEMSWFVGP